MTIRFDPHIHTHVSPCSNMTPQELVHSATKNDLDVVCVTNHGTTAGVKEVKKYASDYDLTVLRGMEISTKDQGDILAVDIDKEIKSRNSVDVLDEIKNVGGISILAHPFDSLRNNFSKDFVVENNEIIDCIEIMNSRCLLERYNEKARYIVSNLSSKIVPTAGSDSHFAHEIGRCYMTSPSSSIHEVIGKNNAKLYGQGGYLSGHFLTKIHQLMN